MANLLSTTIDGGLTEKSGTGIRPAGSTSSDLIQIAGNDDWLDSGNSPNCVMTTCYHRAKNRIVAFFFDGSSQDAYGVAAEPTADCEDLDWGDYTVSGTSGDGWMMAQNHSGNACSYDREKEKILWAGSGHSPSKIHTRVVDLDSVQHSNNRGITHGTEVTWAMPGLLSCCIGPEALIYVGDDAGASAGKHVLLYAHSANNLRAVVGTIGSGNTVDWNTPLTNYAVFGTTTGGGTNYEAGGCKVADNKIAVYWTDGSSEAWCRVGTVASGLITFGTKVQLSALSISSSMAPSATSNCYDIASGKVVFAWWVSEEGSNQKLRARIGTVSGTSITLGTVYDVLAYASNTHGKVSLVYDESAQRSVIYYKRNDGGTVKLFTKLATITGTDITFGTEKLVEAPTGSKTFERGPNTAFSYGCCSTYISHADVKKTVVIRPGGNYANADGGYSKATMTHLNKTTLTVDLSQGNFFELDIDTHTGADGAIGTFTITESLSGSQTQTFFLKIIQGCAAKQFDWSSVTNIKWPASSGPTLSTVNDAVDIFSFTTYDAGTTWHGETVGQNFS